MNFRDVDNNSTLEYRLAKESVDWARLSSPSSKTSEIAGPIAAERELIVRERPE